ncbi:MAG TPA: hypothetical protein VGA89_01870 [Patescibacteria group bacterium]|jgi:hypothetical protein
MVNPTENPESSFFNQESVDRNKLKIKLALSLSFLINQENLYETLNLLNEKIDRMDHEPVVKLIKDLSALKNATNPKEKLTIAKGIYSADTLSLLLEQSKFPPNTILKLLNKIAGTQVVYQNEES